MVFWEDQEAAVIGHQVQAVILMAEVPSDPAIPCCTLPGRGGKAQKSYPFILPGGQVPKGFADLGQGTQVMMLLHLALVTWLFRVTHGTDSDFLKVQDTQPQDEVDGVQRTGASLPYPWANVQKKSQLLDMLKSICQDKLTLWRRVNPLPIELLLC